MTASRLTSETSENPGTLNVLVLGQAQPRSTPHWRKCTDTVSTDGGGVRGLSSLLILEALLDKVRQHANLEDSHVLKPHDVFQLVVGTSTGG